jgi:hypothetical protein
MWLVRSIILRAVAQIKGPRASAMRAARYAVPGHRSGVGWAGSWQRQRIAAHRSRKGSAKTILRHDWVAGLPWPLTPADREAGYQHCLSIWQMEVSRTHVFTRPARGREFFESDYARFKGAGTINGQVAKSCILWFDKSGFWFHNVSVAGRSPTVSDCVAAARHMNPYTLGDESCGEGRLI